VVNLDAAFGHEFFDVAVGQPVSEVPTDGQLDGFGREPVASESGAVLRWLLILVTAHLDRLARTEPIPQCNSADASGWDASRFVRVPFVGWGCPPRSERLHRFESRNRAEPSLSSGLSRKLGTRFGTWNGTDRGR